MPDVAVTASEIQNQIYHEIWGRSHVVAPNYTPYDWWECDVWAVSKPAGLGVEYEVKLSRSDFKADAKRKIERYSCRAAAVVVRRHKHTELETKSVNGPSRFWYVMPLNLVTIEEVPTFAGLMWVTATKAFGRKYVTLTIVRQAPLLHREKVAQAKIDHAKSIFYYRYWNRRIKDGYRGIEVKDE